MTLSTEFSTETLLSLYAQFSNRSLPKNRISEQESISPSLFFGAYCTVNLKVTSADFSKTPCLVARVFHVYAKTISLGSTDNSTCQKAYSPEFKLEANTITINPNIEIVEGSSRSLNCREIIFLMQKDGELSPGQKTLKSWSRQSSTIIKHIYT
jgi:hypothetical protein